MLMTWTAWRAVLLAACLGSLPYANAWADCSSDWKDLPDCLRAASVEYEACLRRWSENPDPHRNLAPDKCAIQRGNDEDFCRQACSSSLPNRSSTAALQLRATRHSSWNGR